MCIFAVSKRWRKDRFQGNESFLLREINVQKTIEYWLLEIEMIVPCSLPTSHVVPVHPASQVQVYVNNPSVQSPLTQGPGMQ